MPSTQCCEYCGRTYRPDPRTEAIQKSCSRAACRAARRAQAQARYVAANPDVFQGRYPKTRQWLKEHPGYLQRYRAQHPEYVKADNRARVERKRRARERQRSDIQDTMRRQIDGMLAFLGRSTLSDMQDGIALERPANVL